MYKLETSTINIVVTIYFTTRVDCNTNRKYGCFKFSTCVKHASSTYLLCPQNDKHIRNIIIKNRQNWKQKEICKINKYTLKALKTSNTCLIIYDTLTCTSKTSVNVTYQMKQKLAESDDTSNIN